MSEKLNNFKSEFKALLEKYNVEIYAFTRYEDDNIVDIEVEIDGKTIMDFNGNNGISHFDIK